MLIKKGRKPFNVNCAWTNVEVINRLREDNYYIPEHTKIIFKTETHWHVFDCNIRDLVSKWSWLWQFVCENGMQRKTETYFTEKPIWEVYWISQFIDKDYEYWLLGSALTDESELESFILNNIKVDE